MNIEESTSRGFDWSNKNVNARGAEPHTLVVGLFHHFCKSYIYQLPHFSLILVPNILAQHVTLRNYLKISSRKRKKRNGQMPSISRSLSMVFRQRGGPCSYPSPSPSPTLRPSSSPTGSRPSTSPAQRSRYGNHLSILPPSPPPTDIPSPPPPSYASLERQYSFHWRSREYGESQWARNSQSRVSTHRAGLDDKNSPHGRTQALMAWQLRRTEFRMHAKKKFVSIKLDCERPGIGWSAAHRSFE